MLKKFEYSEKPYLLCSQKALSQYWLLEICLNNTYYCTNFEIKDSDEIYYILPPN